MARDETPPFVRGGSFYGGGTIDSNNLGGHNILGKEWRFEDNAYDTGGYVTVRCVRNTGAGALLPSRLCQFDPLYPFTAINGYVTTTGGPGVPLDEFLPAAGLPANDIGYVVVQGPVLVLTPLDAGADNVFAFDDPLIGLTAATSGATTAGRVATLFSGTTNPRDSLLNVVGRAMSAKTTANTGAGLLMNAMRWF